MGDVMKILKNILFKIIVFIFILIIICTSILLFLGYNYYSNALKENSLSNRVNTIRNDNDFVNFDDLNEDYINAVIATEDHRFYEHGAIDPIAIARAIYINIKHMELQEGGSTITQQVAKNVCFDQSKNAIRKIAEFFAAYDLEKNYNKKEIFELYVNTAYFGNGYYGIKQASEGYYNKEPKELNLSEASMLAGVPNAPSVYAPTKNPDLAEQRQAQVLKRMLEYGYISQEDFDSVINN